MKNILLILFFTFFGITTNAQQADSLRPTPTVEELAAEVSALKSKSAKWDKFMAALPKISGYAQLGYEWSETSSSFFIHRVRLSLSGDIVASKLDYRIQFEFKSPKIVDVFIRYRPFDELNFQLGEYKVPFSIENPDYGPLIYEFIEYPISLRRLMAFDDISGLSSSGRDMGLQAYGGFFKRDGYSILNYNFGVFNGEGINTWDKNKSKDIAARLTIIPIKGLQFSGSYYWGEYGKDYLKRVRYGAGVCYDKGPVVVRGEYIYGTTGSLDSDGWYAIAGYRPTPKWLTSVRYDTFRENVDLSSTRQTNYTAALSWQPVKYFRAQFNYTYENYASAYDVSDRNVIAVVLTGMF